MTSDVNTTLLQIGFEYKMIREIVRMKINKTGMPFFCVICAGSVLTDIIKENKLIDEMNLKNSLKNQDAIHELNCKCSTCKSKHQEKLSEITSNLRLIQHQSTTTTTTTTDISHDETEINMHNETHCIICVDNEIDIVFLPCSHAISCHNCVLKLETCPICRKSIDYVIKINIL